MRTVVQQFEALHSHVAAVDIPPFPQLVLEKQGARRSRSVAPWALGAVLMAGPAFAGAYSYYASDNKTIKKIANRLSRAEGTAVTADVVVSDSAPNAESAFEQRGFRVVRAATFASGSTAIEISTASGPAVVVITRTDVGRKRAVLMIPQGPTVRFFQQRDITIGNYAIDVNSERTLNERDFQNVVAAALRSEKAK